MPLLEAFLKVLCFELNNLTCFIMMTLSSTHPHEQQPEFFKKMRGSWRISALCEISPDGSDIYISNLLLPINQQTQQKFGIIRVWILYWNS